MNTLKTRFFKVLRDLSSPFLVAVTVFFFTPLYLLLVNKEVFPVTFGDVWQFLLLYTVVAFAGLALVTILFWKVRTYLTALYLGLVIAFIFQSNFPFYSLGKLDGHAIQWSEYSKYLPLDILIWVGILLLCLYFRKALYRNTAFAVGLLLAANLIPVAGRITFKDFLPSIDGRSYLDHSKEFEFSANKNVVVIVLDTFRSEAFAELLVIEPKYAESFKDFTYFPNATAGYPTTKPSIPLILTGSHADNMTTFADFIQSHKNSNLAAFLNQEGIIPEGYFYTGPFFTNWANMTSDMPNEYRMNQVQKGLTLTFIRSLPLPLKQYFVEQFYSGADYYHKNIHDFYLNAKKATVKAKPPVFKFIHLSGAHPPYQLDRSFNRVDKGYLEQAQASLNAVQRLLNEMRAAGIYDNSLIMILGDHGTSAQLELEHTRDRNLSNDSLPIVLNDIISEANALFLAKNFYQEQSSISESNAPVSLLDVPKTIAESLDIENTFPGYSVFADIPDDRIRTFYYYVWSHLDWNNPYLPAMFPFEVQGNVTDPEAWKFLFKSYQEQGIEDVIPPSYQYGQNIVRLIFSSATGAIFSPGFQAAGGQADGIWTVGPVSCTNLTVTPTNQSLVMTIKSYFYSVPDLLGKQTIDVIVDQERVASESNITEAQISIPAELATRATSDNQLQICFGYPDSRSPKELGVSEDTRQLGYFFTNLSIQESGGQTLQGE